MSALPAVVEALTLTHSGLVLRTGFVALPSGGTVVISEGRPVRLIVSRGQWLRPRVEAELAQLVGCVVDVGDLEDRPDGRFQATLTTAEHLAELAGDGHPASSRYADHVQPAPDPAVLLGLGRDPTPEDLADADLPF